MSETAPTPTSRSAAPSATFAFTKLIVANLDDAVNFYARVLGLVVAQTVENADMVEKILAKEGQQGGANLILYHRKDGGALTLGDAHGPVGFYVRDVDAAFAHAVREGAQPQREPFDAGSLRVAFVLDPDGHEIELVSVKR